jgi:capsular polysaccharide biosynthesis protein
VPPGAPIAAFVHRAFWTRGRSDGAAESYIGPVLQALEARAGVNAVRYVAVGPRTNFRARRWWDPLGGAGNSSVAVPIESFAPPQAMVASRRLFGRRHEIRRSLQASADIRAHAVIDGVDCWSLVRDQLAGIALLQFPWSARAMDEAAAALQALRPEVAVTYAEAGGWGRALALESRRAGVPLAGLQHGFIYRHWLNYRHEPDEMAPDPGNAGDRGFPLPARTLLFDEHAAAHLRTAGSFPADALAVTGSPRLDDLIASVARLTGSVVDGIRQQTGGLERPLVLFAAKEREARRALPELVAAVRSLPDLQLAIKPHPAETAGVYAAVVGGAPNIRVVPPETALSALLGAASGVVTVNSTVAIDALALGVPALVIGLPNNLTPFVDAGLMLGANTAAGIREALRKLLYDQEFRSRILRGRSSGAAASAARSAEAILSLRRRSE